jgi:2,4-dienoyl-CoA reductase-like NADH-dependent reductase (Old Yellow Enzyme family)
MAILFEPSQIKDLKLSNRFIRSATWEGLAATDGTCTPDLVDLIVELASGKVGLIITGHAYVSPDGQATPRQLGVHHDALIEGLGEMSEAVHREGGRIIMQLAHGGLRADPKLSGTTPSGPSPGASLLKTPGSEMTMADIQRVVDSFAQAARRAKQAEFDGVQIHAAHGYLLSQFLSPAFNQRNDEYGGTVEKCARIVLEVLQAIRRVVGRYYPIFVKINCEDFIRHGLTLEDFLQIGIMLDRAGIDAIEVSGGTFLSGKLSPFRKEIVFERNQAYFRKATKALKTRIKAPVILVGGIRSYLLAERLVMEGVANYISMSRPFIREPRLIARWQSGNLRKATCISCNGCFSPAMSGKGIYCVQDKSTHG